MQKPICFISQSNDPYLNLAIEDHIFNDMNPGQHILFLWRNSDCVIIGRNQNPWVECNVRKLKEDNVKLVRRHSGGGAVFQDLGNSIFTFMSSKEKYNKKTKFPNHHKRFEKIQHQSRTNRKKRHRSRQQKNLRIGI